MQSRITKRTLTTMGGICFLLLALIILFSPNTPFRFLTNIITASFGFVGYWFVLPFIIVLSIYLIFKNQMIKIKANRILWGLFLIVFTLVIILSSREYLTFQNASAVFKEINNASEIPYLDTALGGGFIGFCLAGALNSLVGYVGTYIISGVLFVAAAFIIFSRYIVSFFNLLKKKSLERKEKKQNNIEEKPVKTEIEEPKQEEKPIIRNENIEQTQPTTLKKAFFEFQGIINPTPKVEEQPVIEEPVQEVEKINEEPVVLTKNDFEAPQANENLSDNNPNSQPKAKLFENYEYPSLDLLQYHENPDDKLVNEASVEGRTRIINELFTNFGLGMSVAGHTVGPSVTRYDIKADPSVSVGALDKYIKDISVRLNGVIVRYEPIVYGKSTSGLEIPNEVRTNVGLREVLEQIPNDEKHIHHIPFGKNISGDLIAEDLSSFPHMLVSGTTGSGKTIFVHSLIISLLMKNTPDELKLVLVDPKKVEMSYYEDIPHLLCPIIDDSRQAYLVMNKLVEEMDRRYQLFKEHRFNHISLFNKWANENGVQPLPYIVVCVDEYAELVDTCKEVKEPIVRIAQKARAAGISLVLATQRPSVNIIDGVIKSNIATRVALLSASSVDSTTIIGEGGAEKLLGHGDMLVDSPALSTVGKPRIQGCYVTETEIASIGDFLRNKYGPHYDPRFLNLKEPEQEMSSIALGNVDKTNDDDELYEIIKDQVMNMDHASISFVQRTFAIGFPRAGKMVSRLIQDGILDSQSDAGRGNKVLVHHEQNQQMGSLDQSTFDPD